MTKKQNKKSFGSIAANVGRKVPYALSAVCGIGILAGPIVIYKHVTNTSHAQQYYALEKNEVVQDFKNVRDKLSRYSQLEQTLENDDKVISLKNEYAKLYNIQDAQGNSPVQQYVTVEKQHESTKVGGFLLGMGSVIGGMYGALMFGMLGAGLEEEHT